MGIFGSKSDRKKISMFVFYGTNGGRTEAWQFACRKTYV